MQRKIMINNKMYVVIGIILILISLLILTVKLINIKNNEIKEKKLIDDFFNNIIRNDSDNDIDDNDGNDIISSSKETDELKNNKIDVFEEQYIAVIEIPKINLKKGLYDINSINNDVDKNIKILSSSKMPNEEFSNLILASHAGSSLASYFKELYKLSVNDYIYLYYNSTKYVYEVNKVFEIEKDGVIDINYSNTKNKMLTLITCKLGTKKQIVVIANLVNEEGI